MHSGTQKFVIWTLKHLTIPTFCHMQQTLEYKGAESFINIGIYKGLKGKKLTRPTVQNISFFLGPFRLIFLHRVAIS